MVGGVSKNKGGTEHLGLPVFSTVSEVSWIKCIYVEREWTDSI